MTPRNKIQNLNKELKVAKQIALKAGKIMLKYFDAEQQVEIKADGSPVTIADIKINQIFRYLMKISSRFSP